jgi:hypothetical protein
MPQQLSRAPPSLRRRQICGQESGTDPLRKCRSWLLVSEIHFGSNNCCRLGPVRAARKNLPHIGCEPHSKNEAPGARRRYFCIENIGVAFPVIENAAVALPGLSRAPWVLLSVQQPYKLPRRLPVDS